MGQELTPYAYAVAVSIVLFAVLAILAVFLDAPKRKKEDEEE